MNYPFHEKNFYCRLLGHKLRYYRDHNGIARGTCPLDGWTWPPFKKLSQVPPYDELPPDQQPEGAK